MTDATDADPALRPAKRVKFVGGFERVQLLCSSSVRPPEPCSSFACSNAESESETAASPSLADALRRLATHISNPKKMKKASSLLRQLLSDGKIKPSHSSLVFEVIIMQPFCIGIHAAPAAIASAACRHFRGWIRQSCESERLVLSDV